MMQTWKLFKIILLDIMVNAVTSFYKEQPTYHVEVSGMGKVTITYAFFEGKFDQFHHICLDIKGSEKCDPWLSHNVMSAGRLKDSDEFLHIQRELYDSVLNRYDVTDFTRRFWRLRQIDMSIKQELYFDNEDNPKFVKEHVFVSDMYYRIVGICAFIVDYDIMTYNELLAKYCFFRFIGIFGQRIFFYKNYRETASVITYYVIVYCQLNYFGFTCWKRCDVTPGRNKCDIDGNEVCEEHYEAIIILYKYWIPSNNYESWEMATSNVSKCSLYIVCKNPNNSLASECEENDYYCYPLSNYSYTCLNVRPLYFLSKLASDINFTYSSLLNGEYIATDLKVIGENNELVKQHSSCSWIVPYIFPRYRNFFIHDNILQTTSYIEYGIYHVTMDCLIGSFRTFSYKHSFVVHVKPKSIWMRNITCKTCSILFLGQIAQCISNGVPQNISRHSIDLISDNFDPVYNVNGNRIAIPLDAKLGLCIFSCTFSFIFSDNRKPYDRVKTFYFHIRSYVFFHWFPKFKNVFTINDAIACRYQAYFQGRTTVKQIIGKDLLNVADSTHINTTVKIGGFYLLICKLTYYFNDDILHFYSSNSMDIFISPNWACILPFFPGKGSIIRCGHNGYPDDNAIYLLQVFADSIELIRSNQNYIKIPYLLYVLRLLFVCTINYSFNDMFSVYVERKSVDISQYTKMTVPFTFKDVMCVDALDKRIENAQQLSETELSIYGELYFLFDNPSVLPGKGHPIIMILTSCTIIAYAVLHRYDCRYKIATQFHCIKMRQLNQAVINRANICILVHRHSAVYHQLMDLVSED